MGTDQPNEITQSFIINYSDYDKNCLASDNVSVLYIELLENGDLSAEKFYLSREKSYIYLKGLPEIQWEYNVEINGYDQNPYSILDKNMYDRFLTIFQTMQCMTNPIVAIEENLFIACAFSKLLHPREYEYYIGDSFYVPQLESISSERYIMESLFKSPELENHYRCLVDKIQDEGLEIPRDDNKVVQYLDNVYRRSREEIEDRRRDYFRELPYLKHKKINEENLFK